MDLVKRVVEAFNSGKEDQSRLARGRMVLHPGLRREFKEITEECDSVTDYSLFENIAYRVGRTVEYLIRE